MRTKAIGKLSLRLLKRLFLNLEWLILIPNWKRDSWKVLSSHFRSKYLKILLLFLMLLEQLLIVLGPGLSSIYLRFVELFSGHYITNLLKCVSKQLI
jgi:hypothetical protein